MYRDRSEAGRVLAKELDAYRSLSTVVVALPRGGVVVGFEVAAGLGATLDFLVVRKLGAPNHKELAIGAVVGRGDPSDPGAEVLVEEVLAHRLQVSKEYIQEESAREIEEIRRREQAYRAGRPMMPLAGRTVIVVDDGVATGSSVRAALRALRKRRPERLVMAVPVGPRETLEDLRRDADEVVCPLVPREFRAVGEFYEDFSQTTDEEVIRLLRVAWGGGSEGSP